MSAFIARTFFPPPPPPSQRTLRHSPRRPARMTLAAPPPPASTPPTTPPPAPQPGVVHTIHTPADFDTLLQCAGADHVIVADFMAKWCRKCVYLKARLPKLATAHPNTYFAIIDVNNVARLPREYGITKMPTFVFIQNGEILESYIGAQEAPAVSQQLREKVAKHAGAALPSTD